MIDILFIILVVAHSSMIGLGIGASTLAITGFLTALADGEIDAGERRIMGVIYVSLRVAMVGIVLSSLAIQLMRPDFFGVFTTPMWIMVAVLFVNAILMTKHWISPKIGPAIQAATWYTLGFLITIFIFDLIPVTNALFLGLYLADIVIAILAVNLFLIYFKRRSKRTG